MNLVVRRGGMCRFASAVEVQDQVDGRDVLWSSNPMDVITAQCDQIAKHALHHPVAARTSGQVPPRLRRAFRRVASPLWAGTGAVVSSVWRRPRIGLDVLQIWSAVRAGES